VTHPQRLGKYQITDVIGQGAMGVVYKGFDPDIRRVVALKTILRGLDEGSEAGVSASARFRNEAQAGGRLMHPGIVGVYEFGQDGDIAYIAMEFVEGQSLAHLVSNKVRFTDEDVAGVMCQVLDALQHAHDQGVWHRDVKPANIIMSRNGRLKVADFGIARIEDAGLTRANVMIGTPTYMAPEQFLDTGIDRRVDIYSAGVLLFLLLTGRPPFTGSPEQLMYKVVHETAPAPSSLEGGQRPRFYDAIVAKALAKDPEQRFASAAAFRLAIEQGVGRPFDTTSWDRTVIAALPRAPAPDGASAAGTQRAGPPPGASNSGAGGSLGSLPAAWDPSTLTRAEVALAMHVGPLAAVLVRRAARECSDSSALHSRLAEHISDRKARDAFLRQARGVVSSNPTASGASGSRTDPSSALAGDALGDELIEQAQRVLAQHVGPIAKVVVKRAAARARDRATFFAQLAEAVTDTAARQRLQAELARLA
jgi:serine/threonine-protein kinase